MSGLSRALSLAGVLSALTLLASAFVAALAVIDARAVSQRSLSRGLALAAAVPLLLMASREPAQPFIAFALVAAVAGPQPVSLALAAGAAVLAAVAPANGPGSLALVLGAAGAAVAAHVVGRSSTAHVASGGPTARPSLAAAVAAGAIVLAVHAGRALRGPETVAGAAPSTLPLTLVLGLALLSVVAAVLLLAPGAFRRSALGATPAAGRRLAQWALVVGAGASLIAAGIVIRASAFVSGVSGPSTVAPGALAAAAGLLAVAVPPLLGERVTSDAVEEEQAATVLSRLVVVLALLATLAAGFEGWRRDGTYVSILTQRLLAAALVGFAASETPRARGPARVLALGALLVAVLGGPRSG